MPPKFKKPELTPQVTTLWDYPSQHYGDGLQGDPNYRGATPSYIIWNLLQRYTKPGNLVIDPMCGSGTTLDVARDLDRRALGYDLNPTRKDIFRVDARKLPLEDAKADFAFVDPPYSTHLSYSDDPRCIGKLSAKAEAYYEAMRQVIGEMHRVLRPDRHMGLYVSDSYEKGKGFFPIGFELFAILREFFTPVDIVSVVRHNKTLQMGNYRRAADEGNFYLRGFNYLFIMYKEKNGKPGTPPAQPAQRPVEARDEREPHERSRNADNRRPDGGRGRERDEGRPDGHHRGDDPRRGGKPHQGGGKRPHGQHRREDGNGMPPRQPGRRDDFPRNLHHS